MREPLAGIDKFPRLRLGHAPTPLDPAPNLGAALGIELWIKRDDCTGLAFGGNKVRQLEFYPGRGAGARRRYRPHHRGGAVELRPRRGCRRPTARHGHAHSARGSCGTARRPLLQIRQRPARPAVGGNPASVAGGSGREGRRRERRGRGAGPPRADAGRHGPQAIRHTYRGRASSHRRARLRRRRRRDPGAGAGARGPVRRGDMRLGQRTHPRRHPRRHARARRAGAGARHCRPGTASSARRSGTRSRWRRGRKPCYSTPCTPARRWRDSPTSCAPGTSRPGAACSSCIPGDRRPRSPMRRRSNPGLRRLRRRPHSTSPCLPTVSASKLRPRPRSFRRPTTSGGGASYHCTAISLLR